MTFDYLQQMMAAYYNYVSSHPIFLITLGGITWKIRQLCLRDDEYRLHKSFALLLYLFLRVAWIDLWPLWIFLDICHYFPALFYEHWFIWTQGQTRVTEQSGHCAICKDPEVYTFMFTTDCGHVFCQFCAQKAYFAQAHDAQRLPRRCFLCLKVLGTSITEATHNSQPTPFSQYVAALFSPQYIWHGFGTGVLPASWIPGFRILTGILGVLTFLSFAAVYFYPLPLLIVLPGKVDMDFVVIDHSDFIAIESSAGLGRIFIILAALFAISLQTLAAFLGFNSRRYYSLEDNRAELESIPRLMDFTPGARWGVVPPLDDSQGRREAVAICVIHHGRLFDEINDDFARASSLEDVTLSIPKGAWPKGKGSREYNVYRVKLVIPASSSAALRNIYSADVPGLLSWTDRDITITRNMFAKINRTTGDSIGQFRPNIRPAVRIGTMTFKELQLRLDGNGLTMPNYGLLASLWHQLVQADFLRGFLPWEFIGSVVVFYVSGLFQKWAYYSY